MTVVVATIFVGSLGIEQRKLKSLLVYSSISHMGYSLIALAQVHLIIYRYYSAT